MKVRLYRNENPQGATNQTLQAALSGCQKQSLLDREQSKNGDAIFMEEYTKKSNGRHVMDFTLRREDGPGLSSPGSKTKDFDLEQGDGFGEQTAVVYCPQEELVAIQYNQHGPRAGAIENYLKSFLPPQPENAKDRFRWLPVMDRVTVARLAQSPVQKKVELGVDTEYLTKESAKNTSLRSALDMRNDTNARMVSLTLALGRSKAHTLDVVEWVKNLMQAGGEAITKLRVEVMDNDQNAELLDLLNAQVGAEVDNKNISKTEGRRLVFSSRVQEIEKKLDGWVKSHPNKPD